MQQILARPATGVAATTHESVDYMMRESGRTERNEGLMLMRRLAQLWELSAGLFKARVNRDQEAVERNGSCIARKKANNSRKNKRKYENLKRIKRMRREYDAALAKEISYVYDESEDIVRNGGDHPSSAGGAEVTVYRKY